MNHVPLTSWTDCKKRKETARNIIPAVVKVAAYVEGALHGCRFGVIGGVRESKGIIIFFHQDSSIYKTLNDAKFSN